jgi:hypothetical protein
MISVLWMRARAQLRGRVGANLFPGRAGRPGGSDGAGRDRRRPPVGGGAARFLAANQTVDAAVGAVLERVGFDAAVRVQADGHVSTWAAGVGDRDNYRLGMLLIGGGLDQPHQK